ncbi:Cysteine desulfurase mitochondrial [Ranunculus cassubicifolius]
MLTGNTNLNLNLNGKGKTSFEWDLNDWAWDGDLFIATPLNSSSIHQQQIQIQSYCSDDNNRIELEKRRRDDDDDDDERNLTLELGGGMIAETSHGKKSKISSVVPLCQVDNCVSDLSVAKDYHRRHKVCEMHSKAAKALVGNVLQRFCQQCSRFHGLQEFDEGKRSCRRRLAGHNRRRRKTHPEATVNGGATTDDLSSNYLLISLLRILSNMHSNNSDQAKDQDLLSHLLKNLAGYEGGTDGRNVSGVIQESKEVASADGSIRASSDLRLISNGHETSRNLDSTSQRNKTVYVQSSQLKTLNQSCLAPRVSGEGHTINNSPDGIVQTLPFMRLDCPAAKALTSESAEGRTNLNNFDLNSVYNDSQNSEVLENAQLYENMGSGYPDLPSWMQKGSQQSSPPHTSVTSDSLSGQSLSSSSGDAQSRTDRIVFKLFGKDPNHFPSSLRLQILNWLSHSPTDIEGYIRPGCVILTIYLRLAESAWQELQDDLSSNLNRLLNGSDDDFWKLGWVYTRVQHQIAFIYNGEIVVDTALPVTSHNHSRISSVTPIAVTVSEKAQFLVKGYNLSRPTARLLCALEGKYLLQDATSDLLDTTSCPQDEQNEVHCLSFPCTVPAVVGRGFFEVEDDGLSSGFYPFIIAEQDVCLEIRMLETAVVLGAKKNEALEFIHEMGWLLHRSQLGHNPAMLFSYTRFRWLVEFSVDHGWVAVVKKLLDSLFDGYVSSGEHSTVELALLDICLLHRAVRRRSCPMVDFLLRYTGGGSSNYLFRPDATGPVGLTPLHIAASSDGSETLVNALTDDPGQVGVSAWKSARDKTGLSPDDYARMRGHYSYIHLIHNKTKVNNNSGGHLILDIPTGQTKFAGFQIGKARPTSSSSCRGCDQQVRYYGNRRHSLVYRPTLLSMLAIAAVCVCVSLFFKSSPEVRFVFAFRWEKLLYGYM